MQLWKDKQFLHGTTILVGTMVGVGIFGIPFVFAKAGFMIGLLFLILTGGVTILFNLMFAEVVLRTKAKHQLVGYTNVYLGSWWKRVVLLTNLLGIYGALLAYTILAGEFSHNVLSNVFFLHAWQYSAIFFVLAGLLIYAGIRTVRWVEFFLTVSFIGIMLATFGVGLPHVALGNLTTLSPAFWFLPYGVMLFAFAGLTSIPIQREVMRGRERFLKKSIVTAVSVVGFLYLVFAFTVVGVSGDLTTPDALSGLFSELGNRVVFAGSLFGLLSIMTSFLLLGTAMLEIFHLDYRMRRGWAWLLVMVPPAVLFAGGLRTFIDIIGLVGTVSIGLESAIFVFLFRRAKHRGDRVPEYSLKVPMWVLYGIAAMFVAAAFYDTLIL